MIEAATENSFKWEVKQRLTLLEATVYWSGEMVTSFLTKAFGISRVQATKDIALYVSLRPNNLRYDRSLKRYQITEHFKPLYITGSAEEYLQILQTYQARQATVVTLLANLPATTAINPLSHRIDINILRPIVQATRFNYELEIRYQGMSTERNITYRIQPCNLFFDGLFWHIRAYCPTRHEFSTFTLARISQVRLGNKTAPLKVKDSKWEQSLSVEIAPHPGLTKNQRDMVEKDYGMTKGKIVTSVRAAMLPHFLKTMGIAKDDRQRDAIDQQIILLNREQLQDYIH